MSSTSSKQQQRIYLQAPSENGATLLIGLQDPHDNNNSEVCILTAEGQEVYILEEGQKGDEELTSLAWLQDTNLLQNIHLTAEAEKCPETCKPTELEESDCSASWDEGSNNSSDPIQPPKIIKGGQQQQAVKPPHSFSALIFLAIESSASKALPVRDIYAWITQHFPYYRQAPVGWKNSVRHNLSLNKCFYKVECGLNMSKGSYWMVDPVHRPQLIQSLCKVSYIKADLIHQLMKDSGTPEGPKPTVNKPTPATTPPSSNCSSSSSSTSASSSRLNNLPDPKLFPFLSRRLAYNGVDPDVDAATAMLALGQAPVDRSSPADDHTYSFSSPRPILPTKNNTNNNNKRPLTQEIAQHVPDMVRELEVCTYILPDRESTTLKPAKIAKTRAGKSKKMTAKQ